MTRECGTCSLCCKLPSIEVLNKPADQWCMYCRPGAAKPCIIYDTRPQVCADFQCEWLREDVEDIWKPLDSKMVMHVSKASEQMTFLNIIVDPGVPNRWRESPYYAKIKQFAALGILHNILVRVQVKRQAWIIMINEDIEVPDGTAQFTVMVNPVTGKRWLQFSSQEKANVETNDGMPRTG